MTFYSRKTILMLASGAFALGVGIYLLFLNASPKLKYTITNLTAGTAPEAPLIIKDNSDVVAKDKLYGVDFMLRLTEKQGKIQKATLNPSVSFKTSWPFVNFAQDLNITLSGDASDVNEKVDVLYEINGSVVNLRPQFYKLRVLDEFGNLIDERAFDMSV